MSNVSVSFQGWLWVVARHISRKRAAEGDAVADVHLEMYEGELTPEQHALLVLFEADETAKASLGE